MDNFKKYSIHGIWFSYDGKVPNSVLNELKNRVCGIKNLQKSSIEFWTDIHRISKDVLEYLNKINVKIKDYHLIKSRWLIFIEKALNMAYKNEDYCCFAIASDILRVAIIDNIKDEFFLYADINDIKVDTSKLLLFKEKMKKMDKDLALPIVMDIVKNNDFIITYRNKTSSHFVDSYFKYLSDNFDKYKKPNNRSEAINAVFPISNIVSFMLYEDLSRICNFKEIVKPFVKMDSETTWMKNLPKCQTKFDFDKNEYEWLSKAKISRDNYFKNLMKNL